MAETSGSNDDHLMPTSSPRPPGRVVGPQIGQATPQDAGMRLAFRLSFAYSRWRTAGQPPRSRRYRLTRRREARAAICEAGEWVREAALWELLTDHHPALVRWARRHLGL